MWLLCPTRLGIGTLTLVLNEVAPEAKPGCLSPAQCHRAVATPLLSPKLGLHHTTHDGDTEVSQHPQGWDRALPGTGRQGHSHRWCLGDTTVPWAAHGGTWEGKELHRAKLMHP